MDFKKFKQEIKQEELSIPGLKENVRAYSRKYERSVVVKERRNYFSYFKYAALLTPIIVMLLVVSIISISVNYSGNNYGLYSVQDAHDLKKVLNYNKGYDFDYGFATEGGLKGDIMEDFATNAPTSPNVGSQGPQDDQGVEEDYSDTNNQELNVDEADIVKTDGKKIYYFSQTKYKIFVYDLLTAGVKSLNQDTSLDKTLMYLSDKYLIVIGYSYYSEVVVNIYDKETLDLVTTYSNKGILIDSRVTNDVLYVVYCQRNVSEKPIDYLDDTAHYYDYEDIKYSRLTVNQGYTYIIAIDLNTLDFNSAVQLGANYWTSVYATENSIYLAVSEYCYRLSNAIMGEVLFGDSSTQTTIFRYELNGTNIEYKGIVVTEGSVKDQFYLDEYDGHLRVVLERIVDSSKSNKLEVYDLDDVSNDGIIKKVASIEEGIGKPRESIKSVKFSDNSCLIVTFLVTDPLYYIDLTDQLNPYIKGDYQEPGYNTYLHYLSDSLAIGFGIDITYKLGLYDISNGIPNKLCQIDGYTKLDVVYNHKALYIEGEVFGFASEVNDTIKVENEIMTKEVYKYQIFTVDYESEQPLLKVLFELTNMKTPFERMVRIKDNYYFIDCDKITIYTTSFEYVNEIYFE